MGLALEVHLAGTFNNLHYPQHMLIIGVRNIGAEASVSSKVHKKNWRYTVS